jgi:hypothetical protein
MSIVQEISNQSQSSPQTHRLFTYDCKKTNIPLQRSSRRNTNRCIHIGEAIMNIHNERQTHTPPTFTHLQSTNNIRNQGVQQRSNPPPVQSASSSLGPYKINKANIPPTTGLALNSIPAGYVPSFVLYRSVNGVLSGVSFTNLATSLINRSRTSSLAIAAQNTSQSFFVQ